MAHRVHLSLATGEPLWIPPLHLTGRPGVGKTRYANDLAEALGLQSDATRWRTRKLPRRCLARSVTGARRLLG